MTLIELLDALIAGQFVSIAEAQEVKDSLDDDDGLPGNVKRDSARLRAAADKLESE